jgi:hypothetical protein
MALNPEQARSARRSIGPRVRLWSSSMASIGQTKFLRLPELDGLRLLDKRSRYFSDRLEQLDPPW